MTTDWSGRNIAEALALSPATATLSMKARAALLGVDKSTLSRWASGSARPRPEHAEKAAQLIGCAASDFAKPTEQLRHLLTGASPDWQRAEPLIRMRMTERWRTMWPEVFDQVRGTHLLYVRLPGADGTSTYSASVLTVTTLDRQRGIAFEIANVDDRNKRETGEEIIYQYSGFLFPVGECLFLIGEEVAGYEPLAIVLNKPPKRSALVGYIVAVGIRTGQHYPMARRIVSIPRSPDLLSYREIRSEVGILPSDSVPTLAVENTEAAHLP